jgi:hypothetical protein
MRYFCLPAWVVLLAMLLMGCESAKQKPVSIEIWRSPNSTLSEKKQAVQELVSPRTKVPDIYRILGPGGKLIHSYGAGYTISGTNGILGATYTGPTDSWHLRYEFPSGAITISLECKEWNQLRFEDVGFVGRTEVFTNQTVLHLE